MASTMPSYKEGYRKDGELTYQQIVEDQEFRGLAVPAPAVIFKAMAAMRADPRYKQLANRVRAGRRGTPAPKSRTWTPVRLAPPVGGTATVSFGFSSGA